MGGTLGAYWARAGHDVLMVDVVPEHVEACATEGLTITGPVETFAQVVPAVTPNALSGRFSRIVLAVKAQATEEAARALRPHLAEDGFVLSAQNGLNELALSEILGGERVMGAFVNFGADWHGPGEVLFGNRGAVVVGEIDGSIRDRTREMHALLQVFEPDAVLTEDIWAYLWGKLGYGAMLFATALTPDSMTENFADAARAPAFLALGREVMAVAAARGVRPKGFNGFEPEAFAPGAPDEAGLASIAALADFNSRTAKTHTGIWRDLAVRKRRTEVDPQIGVIAALGREAGIATPALDAVVDLIHDIEEGRRPQSRETFQTLLDRCG
ncbi:MAG: 2-dehydropantoate 2-reductase N-terminal domain-containing protein [Pseudomonadota bacterium]